MADYNIYLIIAGVCVGVIAFIIGCILKYRRNLTLKKLRVAEDEKRAEEERLARAVRQAEAEDRIRRPEYYAQMEREKRQRQHEMMMRQQQQMRRQEPRIAIVGLVMEVPRGPCNSCRGTGKQFCDKCDGDGFIHCGYCKGAGMFNPNMHCGRCNSSQDPARQPGKERCWACQGNGQVNCLSCNSNRRGNFLN